MPAQRLIKLHRSRRNRWIAGIMGGFAEYFGWSPFLTRLLFVVVSCCSAGVPGILIYFVLWMIMPNATARSYAYADSHGATDRVDAAFDVTHNPVRRLP